MNIPVSVKPMQATHATKMLCGKASDDTRLEPVIVVSHGYENIYERGFCNGLSDNGVEFVLISSDRTDYRGLRAGTRTLNLRGSQHENRPRWQKAANLFRYHCSLMYFALKHRKSTVHMIGLIYPAILCGLVEGLWFRLVSRHYFLTVHNLLPHDRETWVYRIIYHIAFHLADSLVVHTDRARDELVQRHRVQPEKIIVMEHGMEPLPAGPILPASRPSGMPFRLVFFGKVMRYKGVDILLDALKAFPYEFRLTIAGAAWEPALKNELEAQIASHPQRSSIAWRNEYIPEKDLEDLFLQADALVLPYRHIDQSGVLFQGLRFGLPVIATPVGSFENYITRDIGELSSSADAASFRQSLIDLYDRLGMISRQRIAEFAKRYEWQTTIQVLARQYAKFG